jgi:hypothetical protein
MFYLFNTTMFEVIGEYKTEEKARNAALGFVNMSRAPRFRGDREPSGCRVMIKEFATRADADRWISQMADAGN